MPKNLEDNNLKNSVKWRTFTFVIGGILAFVMLLYGITTTSVNNNSGRIDKNREDIAEIKGDLKEIKANTAWIIKVLKYNQGGTEEIK